MNTKSITKDKTDVHFDPERN